MGLKLGIVIPCYNEENRLDVNALLHFLQAEEDVLICLVNDGSHDGTRRLIDALAEDSSKIIALNLPKNVGKAEATRQGVLCLMQHACDYISFLDADFAVSLPEIKRLTTLKTTKIVFGSRIKKMGNYIVRSPYRHYSGRVVATFIGIITKLPVYDSQCGAKIFDKDIILPIFSEPFYSKWLFDVEILLRYRNAFGQEKTLEDIEEIPVKEWIEKKGSKLKLIDFFNVPIHLYKIHAKYN